MSLQNLLDDGIVTRRGPARYRTNFGRTYRLTPALWARPRTFEELQRVVAFACQQRMPIKPVGALYTWSPAAQPERQGIALLTDRLTGVEEPDPELLRGAWHGPRGDGHPVLSAKHLIDTHHLIRVQCGTSIRELSTDLHARGLALKTMGAFGRERIGGAFNTGTHGSSIWFGPMCDSVVSLDAIWQGVPVRVEPNDGPTDPGRLTQRARFRDWVLIQDDDVFGAALVSYGTLGAVASYLIDAGPLYYLEEQRDNIGREAARREIRAVVARADGNVFSEALSAEFYFNLFSTAPAPAGVRVRRILVPPLTTRSHGRWTVDEFIFRFLRVLGIDPGAFFSRVFRALPSRIPAILEFALAGLHSRYRNVSYRVYNMGAANLARSLVEEIGIPVEQLDAYLDDCTRLARRLFETEGWALTAPVGVRFIRPSRALLAVQQPVVRDADGNPRPVGLWAMVNLALTIGTPRGPEMLRLFHDAALAYGGRSHPGKSHFDSPEHMRRCYDLERFLPIREVADPDGCFLNGWNRELFQLPSPTTSAGAPAECGL